MSATHVCARRPWAALKRPAALAVCAGVAFFAAPVFAQKTQTLEPANSKAGKTGGIEEVVVTAERRDERLQDVPAAVSAFSADSLQNMQASDIGDLQGSVPNLSIHEGDADNAVVYLRGVGQVDSLAFADPGVGIYLDDVYLGRAQGAFLDIYDIDRIEVLRGPQGTLYGRNTIGGAVKYVTAAPSDTFGGRAEGTAGNFGLFGFKGSVDVPLGENLLSKFAFAHVTRDGFSHNAFDGKSDGDKNLNAGRIALQYEPRDDLVFRLNVDASDDSPDTSRTPARATPVFGFPATKSDPFKVDANFDKRNSLKTFGVSLLADWRLSPAVELKSISAFRTMRFQTNLDLDATPLSIFGVYDRERQNQVSQEFQIGYTGERLKATAGLFYFREHDVTFSGLFGPDIGLVTGSVNDQLTQSIAAYGQGSYDVTDRFSLTAGLRYTYETKNFIRPQKFFDPATPFPVQFGAGGLLITNIDTAGNWSSYTPKFGLDYRWTGDLLTYASVSRGFKSGGFDGRANTAAGAKAFNPETLWAFETGMKSSWWDRRLIANAALFYNIYTNLQLSSFTADTNGNFMALFTNAGKATTEGVELELTAQPIPALTLSAVAGYLESHYDQFIGPGGVDISKERKLVNAPRWDTQISANYVIDLAENGSLTVGGSMAYRSKTYPVVSSSEVLAQPGFISADAFARYDSPDDVWYVQLGVKNLTDKHHIEQGFDLSDSLGYQLAYYGAPRTVAATAGIRF